MSENNLIIDNLYEKFRETNKIENDYFSKRKSLYIKTIVALMISLLLLPFCSSEIIDSDILINIGMVSFLSIVVFGMTLLKLYEEKIDCLFWFFHKDYKTLTDNKKNIIDYLKQEDVQVEILNFVEEHSYIIDLYELKKSFAFKNHNESFRITRQLFNSLRIAYGSLEAKEKEEKHIRDYEINLRMKL